MKEVIEGYVVVPPDEDIEEFPLYESMGLTEEGAWDSLIKSHDVTPLIRIAFEHDGFKAVKATITIEVKP